MIRLQLWRWTFSYKNFYRRRFSIFFVWSFTVSTNWLFSTLLWCHVSVYWLSNVLSNTLSAIAILTLTVDNIATDRSQEAGGSCRKQADVLFLIDAVSSMDYGYFHRYKLGFVRDVIQQLDVDTGRTQVAVVSFSDSAQVKQTVWCGYSF